MDDSLKIRIKAKKNLIRSIAFNADNLRRDAVIHGFSQDPECQELLRTMWALQSKLLRELRELLEQAAEHVQPIDMAQEDLLVDISDDEKE